MSEVSIDNEAQTAQNGDGQEVRFDPVCIEAPRIYDSCGAKDCLKDLTVFFTAEDQNLVETAASVRVTKASVLTANISVDSVAFNRGYYAVDVIFYIAVGAEVYTGKGTIPATVTGLATASKRVVLYGSDANAKIFSGDKTPEVDARDFESCGGVVSTAPDVTVQVSAPMALASSVESVTAPDILPFVPEAVANYFGAELVVPAAQHILVTLGIFSIVQLSRKVQLMIPSYDFCVPRKECAAKTDDPCEVFSKIEFPTESFFPPSTADSDSSGTPFGCGCE
ncbi:hypothetical protein [Lachnoclostridium sp. MSJ-17]|uniref:hypothetical protein n=1 Tax=Lachnoclostridium sp. MSJ-17 TaxID=2841516 RepID=UPI001C123230|nr:hypothetical protein [Lachnoclostridium sp. MSJ-17]MBU5462587.1 hypothetical protein [Lachnoclostridium sp. MSJ-17]